jgi:hypothetical protein
MQGSALHQIGGVMKGAGVKRTGLFSVFAFFWLLIFGAPFLEAACSSYHKKAYINEVFATNNKGFLEIVTLDSAIDRNLPAQEGWRVRWCLEGGPACSWLELSDAQAHGPFANHYYYHVFDAGSGFTAKGNEVVELQAVLVDGSDQPIDWLKVDSSQETFDSIETEIAGCDIDHSTSPTPQPGNSDRHFYRMPDGTGDWVTNEGSPGASSGDDWTRGEPNDPDLLDGFSVRSPAAMSTQVYTQIMDQPFSLILSSGDQSYEGATVEIVFCGESSSQEIYSGDLDGDESVDNVTLDRATRCAGFRLTDSEGVTTYADQNFSVRPTSIGLEWILANNPPLVAGVHHKDALKANSTAGYDQSLSELTIRPADEKHGVTGFSGGDLNLSGAIAFSTTGTTNLDLNYSEAGRIDANLTDSNWTRIDQPSAEPEEAWGCVKDSNATDPALDSTGQDRIGCNITGSTGAYRRFIPARFVFVFPTLRPHPEHSGEWLYFDANLSRNAARIGFTARAVNDQNETTRNYSDGLYAAQTDLNITLAHNGPTSLEMNATFEGSSTELNATLHADRLTINRRLSTPRWLDGEADMAIAFNAPRDHQRPIDPLSIQSHTTAPDLNLTDQEYPDRLFGESNLSDRVEFYYGRIYAPQNIKSEGDRAVIRIFQEIYCKECSHESFSKLDSKPEVAPDSHDWWIDIDGNASIDLNSSGLNSDRAFTLSGGKHSEVVEKSEASSYFRTHVRIPAELWYTRYGSPYQDPSTHLHPGECQHHPCMTIEFIDGSTGDFGGTGSTDRRLEEDADATRAPQRIRW